MKRTISRTLAISCIAVCACATRTTRGDDCAPLSPESGPFDGPLDLEIARYHLAVYEILLGNERLDRKVQMVEIPMDDKVEDAVYIVDAHDGDETQPKGTYIVVSVRADHSIRYAVDRNSAKISINTARANIDAGTFDEVSALWDVMMERARLPRASDGSTGSTYYFYGGALIGSSASTMEPKARTCARNLVDVGRALTAYARSTTEKQRDEIRRNLLRDVRALRTRLKKRSG